ncbi:GntR family transcriptional regulator [Amycolatopsis pithecellobii]|uniref:FCD domain-containing protein n=1 Tax=Amycolatopsis pithecellobii TaxID=664692 RepID=A0A6N7Z4L7_9PSEU|nr:GntR family transcriptional regulator [Amycolatopsis pithecellobii]MTD55270.1 FCD domain-containing protein [Amycolatopsis pithecellobii]
MTAAKGDRRPDLAEDRFPSSDATQDAPDSALAEDEAADSGRDASTVAYLKIRKDILAGRAAPGSYLNQVHIARELAISRGPLREALRRLEKEGLVVSEKNRRSRVAELSASDAEQLYALRCVNERLAIELSVPLLTGDDLRDMAEALATMHATDKSDEDAWEAAHERFHELAFIRAPSRIYGVVQELREHAGRYIRLLHVERAHAFALVEHEQLLTACQEADAVRAAQIVTSHLARTAFGVLTIIDPLYEPASLRQLMRRVMGGDPVASVRVS